MSRTGAPRRVTFRDVLANREFRALYVAQSISIIGSQLAVIAVSVDVFRHSHSAALAALTFAIGHAPGLIGGPLLSAFADRMRRRNVMLVCEVARCLIFALMAFGHLPIAALLIAMLFSAFFDPPFSSARAALLPDVVGEGETYAVAATLSNISFQVQSVLGFAVGGAVVAVVGVHNALLIDALSFAVSAALIAARVTQRPPARVEIGSWRGDLRDGATVVFGSPRLRWLVIASWVSVGMLIATDAVCVPYAAAHGHGSTAAGILVSAGPLGNVIGGLLVGRALPTRYAERLMLPMALIAPIVLSLTALNPPIWAATVVWTLTGMSTSMTMTANRIFVAETPAEHRGQAFGIAVAGIDGAQVLGAIVAGSLASQLGPAHAVVLLAAISFVILIGFTALNGFSSSQARPILHETPVQDQSKEEIVPARSDHKNTPVWLFVAVILAAACLCAFAVTGDGEYSSAHVNGLWLFVLLVVSISYPLTFEYRRQSWVITLETVPLVLGLLFLSPLHLVFARTGAALVTYVFIRRQPAMRWLFNVGNTTVTTVLTITIFRALSTGDRGVHASVWAALFIAVLAAELASSVLVAAVISLSERSIRLRSSFSIMAFVIPVSLTATCLAIAVGAALSYDPDTFWITTVFLILFIAGMRAYRALQERTSALDRLYVVARELGPIAGDPGDLAPALNQLRRVIRATSLELLMLTSTDQSFATRIRVSEDATTGADTVSVSQEPLNLQVGESIGLTDKHSWLKYLPRPARRSRHDRERMSTNVAVGDRVLGVLSAHGRIDETASFERTDLRLLEAAADQLAAAMEKGRLVESLRRAATLDSLTSLANLDSLRSFLTTMLSGNAGGVLLLLNIDRFHDVNDMLGHDAGDAVLVEVARRLDGAPSHGALSARVGADQFAFALPGAAGSEVARLAALAVKSRVDGSLRFADVSADVRVTVGIARAPDHGRDAATLLRRAEMAMTAAKGTTSGIGEWEPAYERDGSRRLQLLAGLRDALGRGELRVEYQPKIRLGTGDVTGFEALVRWRHPELGPVSPAEFVPLAEATGLISPLTTSVLRAALTSCRGWHDAGKPVGVAVNISARSLDDPVLVGQVAAMLTATGVEPHWLTLEITESSVMENHARSIDVLRQLRMLGVRLSIDDFGTGYSSLHQLRGLPVHEVKIDRSFVDAVDSDGADRAVVKAVVELCSSLGLNAVAEGVETAAQALALESLGVDQVQGFFHGRPMSDAAARTWLIPRRTARLAGPADGTLPGQRSRGQDSV